MVLNRCWCYYCSSVTRSYYRGAAGTVLVYDITKYELHRTYTQHHAHFTQHPISVILYLFTLRVCCVLVSVLFFCLCSWPLSPQSWKLQPRFIMVERCTCSRKPWYCNRACRKQDRSDSRYVLLSLSPLHLFSWSVSKLTIIFGTCACACACAVFHYGSLHFCVVEREVTFLEASRFAQENGK